MGFFSTGRKIEDAQMALVGRYLFTQIGDEEKKKVLDIATYRLKEGGYSRTIDQFEDKVQWLFWALAMAELGFEHGLKWFRWRYIKNPFMITTLEDAHWKTAAEILNKKSRINISYP